MSEFLSFVDTFGPFLNLLIIPCIRVAWKVGKRLDMIEYNQRRLCDKIGIEYIEVK